jgi:hypothetical protein
VRIKMGVGEVAWRVTLRISSTEKGWEVRVSFPVPSLVKSMMLFMSVSRYLHTQEGEKPRSQHTWTSPPLPTNSQTLNSNNKKSQHR